ncbi:hypothetical protein A1351_05075 [Methylosinus sp. R-45379]|jgi:hypothetical protein|uniref:CU044_2847 family protein n=1 Tax=unclassified Methylosinus TaxID=2624500 RepID=UPI000466C530|nr:MULTISPECIES: CU044_2847 family protein [unclassified Methylosinus]OAI31405.1 hypothetical protein A1351_05075 [Methylosinus sp. R-45379]TDX65222.1 hypothetical protein EDE12_103200 [Methylosinus sp. sav-2]
MSANIIIEAGEGRKIYFGGAEGPEGLESVGALDRAAKASADQFAKAMGSLSVLVEHLRSAVEAIPDRPQKVEIEFGASLTGDCDLWVVSGEGKAEFKVKLAWEKPKKEA